MDPKKFNNAVDAAVRSSVPRPLASYQHTARGSLAKWWYGNPALHYECGLRSRSDIEIGLHFEADPLTNARLLAAFRGHAKAIGRALPDARIEDWDRGWARVWEPVSVARDEIGAKSVGRRLAGYITALEPILRDELPTDVEWTVAPAQRGARVARRRTSRR